MSKVDLMGDTMESGSFQHSKKSVGPSVNQPTQNNSPRTRPRCVFFVPPPWRILIRFCDSVYPANCSGGKPNPGQDMVYTFVSACIVDAVVKIVGLLVPNGRLDDCILT